MTPQSPAASQASPSVPGSSSSSLGQTFLAMLVCFGKTRELGLEPGNEIIVQWCEVCQANTDHLFTSDGRATCLHPHDSTHPA